MEPYSIGVLCCCRAFLQDTELIITAKISMLAPFCPKRTSSFLCNISGSPGLSEGPLEHLTTQSDSFIHHWACSFFFFSCFDQFRNLLGEGSLSPELVESLMNHYFHPGCFAQDPRDASLQGPRRHLLHLKTELFSLLWLGTQPLGGTEHS